VARRASAPVDSKLVGTVTNRTFKMFGGRRKHQSLMALSLIFYFLAGAALAQNATSTLNFDAAAEQQFVQMINQDRAQNGLPPLFVDERLTEAARLHTELMVQHSALSHRFPGEPAIEIRFSNQSLPSDREAENVALGQTVLEAHDALMQSPPHRQNILDSQYNVIGVGVIAGPEGHQSLRVGTRSTHPGSKAPDGFAPHGVRHGTERCARSESGRAFARRARCHWLDRGRSRETAWRCQSIARLGTAEGLRAGSLLRSQHEPPRRSVLVNNGFLLINDGACFRRSRALAK
jgi:Cysteine-rich secretory protein family